MGATLVPAVNPDSLFPTLGPQVVEWMESSLVHGPGDVRGEPYALDPEKVRLIYHLYEVNPPGHPKAGRRRFKRAGVSVRKGWAKTELLAAIAAAELHPDAPVRCDGFDANGDPVGIGVMDPYIPMVAYTEEQSEELAYGALLVMLSEGPLADDFDLGVERIAVIGEGGRPAGKAVALAAAPDSRDGARTTFQGFDETHRQTSPRLIHAHETMLANIPKRLASDAWTLEVTTAYEPGTGSIAEGTHEYAKMVQAGKVKDDLLFFYHRQAGDEFRIRDEDGNLDPEVMRAAVLDASGEAAKFTDVDYIVSLGQDPQVDPVYWERVWLNRVKASGRQFFNVPAWDKLDESPGWQPPRRDMVVLGFDGSKSRDATALVGTHVETGRQFVVAVWERPVNAKGEPLEGWEVPEDEVDEAVQGAFDRWDVVFLYADPYWWEELVANWIGRYGTRRIGKRRLHRVVEWHTNRPKIMAFALRAYNRAIGAGDVAHDGHKLMREHLGNAVRRDLGVADDEGQTLAVIEKARPDSTERIDLAMAGCLSWEARRDAVAAGVRPRSRAMRTY